MRRYTYVMPAEIDRWLDGDTAEIHLGIYPGVELHSVHVRIEGINAPELNSSDPAVREAARAAKTYAESIAPAAAAVEVVCTRTDKYGRLLGRLRLADGRDFGDLMIAGGFAVPYMA